MILRINEINTALDQGLYRSALCLALTIPDICGQIAYPHFHHPNGNRKVGKQYKKWFDVWMDHHFTTPNTKLKLSHQENIYFNGQMCYELRCSFLHSGNFDIQDFSPVEDADDLSFYSFELCLQGNSSVETSTIYDTKETIVRINLVHLCHFLCDSGRKFYNQIGEHEFLKKRIDIIDLQV